MIDNLCRRDRKRLRKIVANTIAAAARRKVLRFMADHNHGAIVFEGAWRFPQAFRDDAGLAVRFARTLGGK